MNLIQDTRVFDKYFSPIKDQFTRDDISEIIVHGTSGGQSAKGIINWMLGGERAEEYKKGIGLFHYEIDRNGDVYQLIPNGYWCYHSSSGQHDKVTVGIELVNPEKDNFGKYKMEQYKSLMDLIKMFMLNYQIKVIAGHGATKLQYSGSYKYCPGKLFDWELLEKNFNIKKIKNEMYVFV